MKNLFLILVILVSFFSVSFADNALEKNEKTFMVGRDDHNLGSGFPVMCKDNFIFLITNKHVTVGSDPKLVILWYKNDKTGLRKSSLVFESSKYDFAVVKARLKNKAICESLLYTLAPPMSVVKKGDKVSLPTVSLNGLLKLKEKVFYGKIKNLNVFVKKHNGYFVMAKIKSNPGNSGSPLLNEKGQAIGLLTGGNKKGESYFLSLEKILEEWEKAKKKL